MQTLDHSQAEKLTVDSFDNFFDNSFGGRVWLTVITYFYSSRWNSNALSSLFNHLVTFTSDGHHSFFPLRLQKGKLSFIELWTPTHRSPFIEFLLKLKQTEIQNEILDILICIQDKENQIIFFLRDKFIWGTNAQ